jgi:hypothetical protein
VRFEVFAAMTMKNTVFWNVAPCRYFVNRRFGGTYRLHLQGISNPRAMNQREQITFCFLSDGNIYCMKYLIYWCNKFLNTILDNISRIFDNTFSAVCIVHCIIE